MDKPHTRYPIGIEDFGEIKTGGYLYIDKTEYLHRLLSGSKYYLLCRPRRFGKSLFLSMTQAFFEGKHDLFEGLAITRYDYDWQPHPVLHLNLVGTDTSNPEALKKLLSIQFQEWERMYGLKDTQNELSIRFGSIIRAAFECTGKQVVILVDEYDKPLVSNIDDDRTKDAFRNILKPIYSSLKGYDKYIKMALLTGVSRFSRLSIFSDLNNLNDISMDSEFDAVCGITEEEMLDNCREGIMQLADKNSLSYDEAVAKLKENYDGYHFSEESPDMYNPFSLLCALSKKKIQDFWFATGTPTFLLKAIVAKGVNLEEYLNSREADSSSLTTTDTYSSNIVPLMFQTGYLTITGYDRETQSYHLGIPNREVEKGIFKGLMPMCTGLSSDDADDFIRKSGRLLYNGFPQEFLEHLKALLADIPYSLTCKKTEIYFENNLYVIFKMLGYQVSTEYHTSRGRIDVLVKTPKFIYIMELKRDGSAAEAMRQIENREYAIPFSSDGRQIVKIGINFSSESRTITDWLIERQSVLSPD